jgi:large subunit ribosomal protein L20
MSTRHLINSIRRCTAGSLTPNVSARCNPCINSYVSSKISLFHSLSGTSRSSLLGSRINRLVLNDVPLISMNNSSSVVGMTRSARPMQLTQVRGMASRRHKKIIKMAKGLRGRANRCYTIALPRVLRMLRRQYIGRKLRKRDFRRLWITRINAASRIYGMAYRHLIHGLSLAKVSLNRKVMADLAVSEPLSFKSVVEVAKQAKTKHGSWPLKEKKAITFSHFLTGVDRHGPKKLSKSQSA